VAEYGVKIVADDDLPGHDWMFVSTDRGPVLILTRTACKSARLLSECWAAWRTIYSEPQRMVVGERHLRAV
jgi:hypothetical protein